MKNRRKHLLILTALVGVLLVLGQACKKDDYKVPEASTIADFTYTLSNDGYFPCSATFSNISINAAAYLWDFGNGQTSTETNPVVAFSGPGLYTVTLTCTPVNQLYYNKLTKKVTINVKDPGAGKATVLYFTDRASGSAKLVILDNNAPVIQEFTVGGLSRPYGIAVDTAHQKVYVTDYGTGKIHMANADGSGMVEIVSMGITIEGPYGIVVAGDYFYYSMADGIYRAGLDGSNPVKHISFGGNVPKLPLDLEYDALSQKIYFVNDRYDPANGGGLWSVNPDGTGLTTHIPDIDGVALELNPGLQKMYFIAYGVAGSSLTEDGVYLSDMNGSGISKIGVFGTKASWGIAQNPDNNSIYWGYRISNTAADGKIIRASADGSGPTDWLTGINPCAITIAKVKL